MIDNLPPLSQLAGSKCLSDLQADRLSKYQNEVPNLVRLSSWIWPSD
jgi:hypothetical protein